MDSELIISELKKMNDGIDKRLFNLEAKTSDLECQMLAPNFRPGHKAANDASETVGARFVKETDFLAAVNRHGRGRLEFKSAFWPETETKTILASGQDPGLMPADRRAPIAGLAVRRLRIRDLLNSRTTTLGSVEFIRQLTRPVASPQIEGQPKHQSNVTFELENKPVQTVAVWVPASRQILSDLPGLQTFINGALMNALLVEEENQLLAGDATGANLSGLLTEASSYSGTYDVGGDTPLDTLAHAILELRDVDETPTGMVLSPKDHHDILLLKTEDSGSANTGSYLVGSPLGGVIEVPSLWGLALVVSNSLTPGTFLIGDFQTGAQIHDRMDATIDISTEHDDYFVRNMVAIRAEERLALTVARSSAFLTGTF